MKKLILSTLMIVGTTIGGAMLALPAVTAGMSLVQASLMIAAVCAINIVIAFCLLEAIMYFPSGANLISLSRRLLGKPGAWLAWALTILFFYCLLSAYLAGASDIIGTILNLPAATLILPIGLLVAAMLYFGFELIAQVNQWLVIGFLACFAMIVLGLLPNVQPQLLASQANGFSLLALPTIFTSFGFLAILPSLRDYLDNNTLKMKTAIVAGSLIPLAIYLLWLTVVMGILPNASLAQIAQSNDTVKDLVAALMTTSAQPQISRFVQGFVFLSMLGSLIGVSVALFDCMADAINIQKTRVGRIKLASLVCAPGLIVSVFAKGLFLLGLRYAGQIAMILFALYPVMMVWSGRYVKQLTDRYQGVTDKLLLVTIAVFACGILLLQ